MDDFLLVGVDGGGTHCRARIRRPDGAWVGEGRAGSANLLAGLDQARASVVAAIAAALRAGGLGDEQFSRCLVGLGLAGANVRALREGFLALPLPFAAVALESDAAAACRGAHGGRDGGIAILGTGTAFVAILGGRFVSIGGWGFHLSDEGSGAILGRAALRQALLACDGVIAASPLTDELLAGFGRDPERMVEFGRTALPRDYGAFAPAVFDAAERGDPVGRALVAEAGRGVELALKRLVELGAPRLALMGGLAARYWPLMPGDLAARLVEPAADAMEGALRRASALVAAPAAGRARA